MKKLGWIFLCLLFLCGCGGEKKADMTAPPRLEVEYGDSGIEAARWGYSWSVRQGEEVRTTETDMPDPYDQIGEIPYLNRSKAREMKLLFDVKPDKMQVQIWNGPIRSKMAQQVTETDGVLPVLPSEAHYLYEITATWNETQEAKGWGTCTYYFRFLPKGVEAAETESLPLYRLLQLKSQDLFGVEILNNLENAKKTCRTSDDVETVLEFLKNGLTVDFTPLVTSYQPTDYALRLLLSNGGQLTFGYGEKDKDAWIFLDGIGYEAQPLDMGALWNSLEAKTVSLAEEKPGEYLQTSEDFPGEGWGEDYVFGFLRGLDGTVAFDEMIWIDDKQEPNGYRLKEGKAGQSLPLAENCEYWLLENHEKPFCQVERETLWTWNEGADWDILYRIYKKDGQVITICEQYRP